MAFDRRVDVARGAATQPRLEDRGERAAIGRGDPHDQLVDPARRSVGEDDRLVARIEGRPAADDRRAALAGPGGLDPEPVRAATEREARPVDELVRMRPGDGQPGALLGGQVTADPGFALDEERHDVRRGVARSRAAGRDRHDDAAGRVDDEAQASSTTRPTEGVAQGSVAELGALLRLDRPGSGRKRDGRGHRSMVPRPSVGRALRTPGAARHRRVTRSAWP